MNEAIDNQIISLKNVTKIYNSNFQSPTGVVNITLQAYPGELLLIIGPSGSGKTTLLTLIAGLIEPASGNVSVFGKDILSYSHSELQALRASKIGFVFQTFRLIESLTGIENICMSLQFAGKSKHQAKKIASELLEEINLSHLGNKFPITFSQGEKQRVAILRAIANDADLILADEPTASLASNQGFKIITMLHQYAKNKNKCVIIVSHDLRVKKFADRIIKIEDGKLIQ